MIAVRPAITKIPSGIPTPSPTLLVLLNPDEDADGDGDAELPAELAVGVETCDMVEVVELEEEVDVVFDIEDDEEVLVLDWLVVAGRLAIVCPTAFKNTPCPSSQQLGNLSQQ